MPLQRRLPKFGFKNIHRREYAEVKVGSLEGLTGVVDAAALKANGLVRGQFDGVVLLAGGELTSKVTVKVDRVTAGARAAVEKAGGTVELLPAPVTMYQKAKAAKRAAAAKP
jgi:large subunit ribosomal protein L15